MDLTDKVASGIRSVYYQEVLTRQVGRYTPWDNLPERRKEQWRLMAMKAILVVRNN
jgi:hypothetical protein